MKGIKKSILVTLSLLTLVFISSCGKKETVIGGKSYNISRNYAICIAEGVESAEVDSMRQGFVVGLKDLGLVEDVNVTYYYENAKGNKNYAEQIADLFATKNPDLILTIGNTAVNAIKNKFDKTPIVFLGVANAERLGLCDSKGVPTANLTGVVDSHLIDEQLSYINKNHTEVKRLGIIYDSSNELAAFDIDYFKFNATNYDIDIYTVSIGKADDIDKALDNILPKVDAIMLVYDNIVNENVSKVIDRTKSSKKLVFGQTEEHKNAGAEVSVIRDYKLVGEKGAALAKQILVDGKKVKDINVVVENFKVN